MWIEDEKVNNEFVTVKGIKLFCPAFVAGLDYYRINRAQKMGRNDEKYDRMIYPLQELTADWCTDGIVDVPEPIKEFIMRNGFERPEANKMPEVIDELLDQMKKKIILLDVDELLSYCAKLSAERYAEYLGKRAEETKRCNKATELADACKKTENPSAIDDVDFLYKLQKAKQDDSEYKTKDEEVVATRLLANLLLQSTVSSNVPFWLIKDLVSNKFAEESDVDDLLNNKYDDKRDWEWFSEDMLSWDAEEETDFKIDDILGISLKKLLETIGIDESYLHIDKSES